MTDPLYNSRNARVQVISGKGQKVIIFKENPLFDYFSSDERAESVLLHDGQISLIGDAEVDKNFCSLDGHDYCVAPPYFEFRKGKLCSSGTNEWFEYPLQEELRYVLKHKKKIGELIESVTSEMRTDDTENTISELIRNRLCSSGYSLYYGPVVAFDRNTLSVWNKPGDSTLKKIMYIEVASKKRGLTILYSNSFLATSEEAYVDKYKQSIEALELLKKKFVEGNTTAEISSEFERFRNDKLYLTTPLFPFSYHPVPGTNTTIKTGDTAVFDFWVSTQEFSFRRKAIAIAGSYRGSVI